MQRKHWIIAVVVALSLLAAAGAVVGGLYYSRYRSNLAALVRAEQRFAEGDWLAARNNYAIYISKYRDDYEALKKYAEASANLMEDRPQNVILAASALFQVVREVPDDFEAERRMIELYLNARQWGDLERTTGFLRQRRPDDLELAYKHALALDSALRRERSETAYRELIERGTPRLEAYGNLARILRQQGRVTEAEALLNALVDEQRDNAKAHVQQAHFYLSDQPDRARQAYDAARRLAPDDPDVLHVGLLIAMDEEDYDEATVLGDAVLGIAPERSEIYLPLAIARQRNGDIDSAIRLITDMDPLQRIDQPELLMTLAELLIGAAQHDEARDAIAFYRRAYPTRTVTHDYLDARILLAQGDVVEALNKLLVVTETMPSFGSARYYLILAHLHLGERDRARNALETYMRNFPADERARALYQEQFVVGASVEGLHALAERLLVDNATPEQLTTTARRLLAEAQYRPQALDAVQMDRIVRLLERAIERDPTYEAAYALLSSAHLAHADAEAAARVVEEAGAAGVPAASLGQARVGIALANGDVAGAFEIFLEASADLEKEWEDMLTWANLFGTYGEVETGLRVLDVAIQDAPEDRAALLRVRQAAFCTRFNALDRARELIEGLDAGNGLPTDARADLNRERVYLAEAYMATSPPRRDEASQLLRQAARGSTRINPRIPLLEAQLFLLQDPPRYGAARDKLDEALENDPRNVDVLLAMHNLLMRQGDLDDAAAYAARAAREAPESFDARLAHARTLVEMGQHADAQSLLSRIVDAYPDAMQALELLVRSYGESGRTELAQIALSRLEQQIEATPEQRNALDVMRISLDVREGRNLTNAVRRLQELYAENPNDLQLLGVFVDALTRLDRHSEAERLMQGYLERDEEDVRAWVMLGQLREARAGVGAADSMSAYTRALLLQPDYPPALQALVRARITQGQLHEALALADRYLAIRPDDDAILYEKARLLAAVGNRFDEAARTVSRAIELRAQPEYLYLRGTLYLALERQEAALEDLQRASAGGTSSARHDAALAEAYWGVGQQDMARRYLESSERKAERGEPVDDAVLERLRGLIREEEGST